MRIISARRMLFAIGLHLFAGVFLSVPSASAQTKIAILSTDEARVVSDLLSVPFSSAPDFALVTRADNASQFKATDNNLSAGFKKYGQLVITLGTNERFRRLKPCQGMIHQHNLLYKLA